MTPTTTWARRARATLFLLAPACAALLLAHAGRSAAAAATEVRIARHAYAPAAVTVPRGTTVRWVNEDDDPHTVTADGGKFASRGIDTREEFAFTFDAPGSYPYHCALHPMMTGVVVVK